MESKSLPAVCAIMLVNGRQEMVKQAVASFEAQTYADKRLLIYDTSPDDTLPEFIYDKHPSIEVIESSQMDHHHSRKTIGYLRNRAIMAAEQEAEIIVHFDSDDWSHPNRIAEQVELLQASGADAVGYNEMLFWRESGEAWLYSGVLLGTSLCYWRKTWERLPFKPTSRGEYEHWRANVRSREVSSIASDGPRMLARIHAGNTSNAYDPPKMRTHSEWKRTPQWDDFCRDTFVSECLS